MSQIIQLALAPRGMLNVYLLRAQRTVLIDTGVPQSGQRILRLIEKAGVSAADISLILLTHGHVDHAGSAAELRALLKVPVAISRLDAPLLERGSNQLPPPTTLMGAIIRLTTGKNPTFPALPPDILLDDHSDLQPFGVNAQIISTPGHTPGMIALLTENNEVIAGDALAGHPLFPRRPSVMYLHEDPVRAAQSLRRLAELRPRRYHVGHGGPLEGDLVQQWLAQGHGQ